MLTRARFGPRALSLTHAVKCDFAVLHDNVASHSQLKFRTSLLNGETTYKWWLNWGQPERIRNSGLLKELSIADSCDSSNWMQDNFFLMSDLMNNQSFVSTTCISSLDSLITQLWLLWPSDVSIFSVMDEYFRVAANGASFSQPWELMALTLWALSIFTEQVRDIKLCKSVYWAMMLSGIKIMALLKVWKLLLSLNPWWHNRPFETLTHHWVLFCFLVFLG